MTTRGVINSNFYQIVNVDADGNPTDVKPEYLPNVGNANYANYASYAGDANNATYANYANHAGQADFAFDAQHATYANQANYATQADNAYIAGYAYNVDVANVAGIGNIATINLTGDGTQVLLGNGTFNNLVDNANYANYANFAGNAIDATYANYANFAGSAFSVDAANVIGLGSIATINLDGNSGNILYGNGVFSSVPDVGNANYANFSGEAYSVSGSNVIGEVANSAYANSANIANSIAPGSEYNLLYHGPTSNGGLVEAIDNVNWDTSTNTLYFDSNIQVRGGGGNFIADSGHYFVGDGGYLSNIAGSNVSGQVSNALVSGTVYSSSQPNITSLGSLVSLDVDGEITGHANISGTYILGNGAFLTGVGDFSASKGYWGSFYSNVSQTASSTTTAYPITLNNSDPNSYGVYVSSNSRVNFTYAGRYNFQFSLQFLNTNAATVESSVWLRKNGVDIPDSRGAIAVTDKQAGVNGQLLPSWNYILELNANDYLELIWQTENTSVSLEYLPPGTTPTSPASPSAIVTAMQVTNVQAATLSGDLTGNLIGNSYGLTGVSFVNITGNIEGNVFIGNGSGLTNLNGANVTGVVANATYANLSNIANTAYGVSGSNVTGTVANANYASFAGNITVNSQPNITSVGTLTTLTSSGNITAPYFIGNVVGNISGNIVVPGLQWDVLYNNSGNAGASTNFKFDAGNSILTVTGNVDAIYYSGNGAGLTNINGSNVSNVANSNYSNFSGNAYSVSVGNVVGIGNIATLNLDGNSGNILYGNGVFSAVPNVSNVANANSANFANYANFAGTAYSVSGSNVSGQVSNALVAGTVYTNAQPNITQVGTLTSLNVATSIIPTSNLIYDLGNNTNRFRDLYLSGNSIYLDGQTISANTSGISITGTLSGDGGALSNITGSNVTGTVANANYSVYSGTSYSVSGSNVSGTVANANYSVYSGTSYSVSGSNVSGVVANANYASYAGNVTGTIANANFANYAGNVVNSSQPNITSVGTLTSLTVSGNINSNNIIAGNLMSANSFIAATQTTATTPGGSLSLTYLSPQNQNFTGSSIYDLVLPDPSTLTNGAYWFVNNNSTNNIIVKNYAGTTLYTVLPGANTKFIFTGGTSWDYHSFLPNTMSASSTTANLANLVVSNYFSGNGSLLTSINGSNVSNVANANYANFAGNAYSVSGSNVSGTVANANYAAYSGNSYSVDGSNVSGQVSNALIAGTVYTNSQPNITSLGTLSSLSVTGNISTSNYFVGNGYYLTGISGGGTPGGSNTYVQFNDGSTFGGNAGLTFNKTNGNLTVGGNINVGANIVDSGSNWSLKYTPQVMFTPGNLVLNGPGGNFYSGGSLTGGGGFAGDMFSTSNANITNQLVTTNIEASALLLDNSGNINTRAVFNFYSTNGFASIGPGTIYYSNTGNTFSITSANSITIAPVGNTLMGAISKVKITGGSSGQVISTDGTGNLSFVAQSGGGGATDFVPSFLLGGM